MAKMAFASREDADERDDARESKIVRKGGRKGKSARGKGRKK